MTEMEKGHSLGLLVERIPGMGVYTRKAASARHKVRIVASMMTSSLRMLRIPEQDLGGEEGSLQMNVEGLEDEAEPLMEAPKRPHEPVQEQMRRAVEEVNQRAVQDYGSVLHVNRSKIYRGRVGFDTEVALKSTSTLSDRVLLRTNSALKGIGPYSLTKRKHRLDKDSPNTHGKILHKYLEPVRTILRNLDNAILRNLGPKQTEAKQQRTP